MTQDKKVQLKLAERFVMLELFPTKGSFLELRHMEKLKDQIIPGLEECQVKDIVDDGKQVRWNKEKDWPVEMTIPGYCADVLVRELKKKDKEGALDQRMLSLYEKFVEN